MKTSTTTVAAISRRRIWLLNNGIADLRYRAGASLNQLTIFRCELLHVSRPLDADRGRLRAWSNGLQNRKEVAPQANVTFPEFIVPVMQALLLAAAFKVEDAHGEQADRCRHLSRDGTVAVLHDLRRLADEYKNDDELEDDEVSAKCADSKD
jgi:hypothetical protein